MEFLAAISFLEALAGFLFIAIGAFLLGAAGGAAAILATLEASPVFYRADGDGSVYLTLALGPFRYRKRLIFTDEE